MRRVYDDTWLAATAKAAVIFIVYFMVATVFIVGTLLLAISQARTG